MEDRRDNAGVAFATLWLTSRQRLSENASEPFCILNILGIELAQARIPSAWQTDVWRGSRGVLAESKFQADLARDRVGNILEGARARDREARPPLFPSK